MSKNRIRELIEEFKGGGDAVTRIVVLDTSSGKEYSIDLSSPAQMQAVLRGAPDGLVGQVAEVIHSMHEMIDSAGKTIHDEMFLRLYQKSKTDVEAASKWRQLVASAPEDLRSALTEKTRSMEAELALREKEAKGEHTEEPLVGPEGAGQFVVPGDGRVH